MQDQGQTDEMKWNTGPQFNAEASCFSIPTDVSLLDSSGDVMHVNSRQFPPAGLFVVFQNLVLHLRMSSQESVLLKAVMSSSLCGPQHLVFLKCDLVLCGMQASARSASQADSHPPIVSPFSSGSLSLLQS